MLLLLLTPCSQGWLNILTSNIYISEVLRAESSFCLTSGGEEVKKCSVKSLMSAKLPIKMLNLLQTQKMHNITQTRGLP